MAFVIGLPILTNWKQDNYKLILVIIDWLIKIIYYKLVKVSIDISGLAEVIKDMVICHYGFLNLIFIDKVC